MRSRIDHALLLRRIVGIESTCGSSGSFSCASLLLGLPLQNRNYSTRLTDHAHLADVLFLSQTQYVARIVRDSGSRKAGLVDEDEANACLSLRSKGWRSDSRQKSAL